jgi:hypothetical protein
MGEIGPRIDYAEMIAIINGLKGVPVPAASPSEPDPAPADPKTDVEPVASAPGTPDVASQQTR